MRCVNGHELPPGEERECPTCDEPAQSLIAAERRRAAKTLPIGLALFVGIGGGALLIGSVAPIEAPASGILAFILVFPFLGGLVMAIGSVYTMIRAPAVVRHRIKRSKEPMALGSFVCPKCSTQNQGPFQKPIPECLNCWAKVVGAVCWRCGNQAPVPSFDGEEPVTEYRCEKCGQQQALPSAAVTAWWR